MRDVPQAAPLSGYPMARRFLGILGELLLFIGGIGIIAGLVWLTESKLNGTLLHILEEPGEVLLYTFPALLFLIAIVGVGLVSRALHASAGQERTRHAVHHHTRFHA